MSEGAALTWHPSPEYKRKIMIYNTFSNQERQKENNQEKALTNYKQKKKLQSSKTNNYLSFPNIGYVIFVGCK